MFVGFSHTCGGLRTPTNTVRPLQFPQGGFLEEKKECAFGGCISLSGLGQREAQSEATHLGYPYFDKLDPTRGEKVLVFCQWEDLKRRISDALGSSGVPHVQLSGNVWQRADTLRRFQALVFGENRSGEGDGGWDVLGLVGYSCMSLPPVYIYIYVCIYIYIYVYIYIYMHTHRL